VNFESSRPVWDHQDYELDGNIRARIKVVDLIGRIVVVEDQRSRYHETVRVSVAGILCLRILLSYRYWNGELAKVCDSSQ